MHGVILAQTGAASWALRAQLRTRMRSLGHVDGIASAGIRQAADFDTSTIRTPGIRRVGSAKRFRYVRPNGRAVSLRPSWRASRRSSFRRRGPTCGFARIRADICRRRAATRAAASSTGITRAGARCATRRSTGGCSAFAQALPRIRRRTAADLRKRGLPREKVLAAVVQLLEKTLIRVGNEEYARDERLVRADDDARPARDGPRRGRAVRVPRQERHRARRSTCTTRGWRASSRRAATCRATSCSSTSTRTATRQAIDSADVNAYLRRHQRRRFHRQGLPHLGRHRARGAGAGRGSRRFKSQTRSEAERRAGDRVGRQAAWQHEVGLPEVLHPPGDPRRLYGRPRPTATPLDEARRSLSVEELPWSASSSAGSRKTRVSPPTYNRRDATRDARRRPQRPSQRRRGEGHRRRELHRRPLVSRDAARAHDPFDHSRRRDRLDPLQLRRRPASRSSTSATFPGRNIVALIDDDQPCLAEREIRHFAEPILLLAHEDRETLLAADVQIDYRQTAPVYDPEASPTVVQEDRDRQRDASRTASRSPT